MYGSEALSKHDLYHGNFFENLRRSTVKTPLIFVPGSRHYSWEKAVQLVGLGDDSLREITLDRRGKISIDDLESKLGRAQAEDHPVIMIVSVAGTT